MAPFPEIDNKSLFVDESEAFDFNEQIENLDSQEFRIFITRLVNRINQLSAAVNKKSTGIYSEIEFVNANTMPPITGSEFPNIQDRPVFWKLFINTGLSNPLTQIPHGLTTPGYTFIRIWGVLNDTFNLVYLPVPYVDVSGTFTAGNIEVYVDNTNINVTVSGDAAQFDTNYFVLEYIKT